MYVEIDDIKQSDFYIKSPNAAVCVKECSLVVTFALLEIMGEFETSLCHFFKELWKSDSPVSTKIQFLEFVKSEKRAITRVWPF